MTEIIQTLIQWQRSGGDRYWEIRQFNPDMIEIVIRDGTFTLTRVVSSVEVLLAKLDILNNITKSQTYLLSMAVANTAENA